MQGGSAAFDVLFKKPGDRAHRFRVQVSEHYN